MTSTTVLPAPLTVAMLTESSGGFYRLGAAEVFTDALDDEITTGTVVTNRVDEPIGYIDHAGAPVAYGGRTFTPVTVTAGGRSWVGMASGPGDGFIVRTDEMVVR